MAMFGWFGCQCPSSELKADERRTESTTLGDGQARARSAQGVRRRHDPRPFGQSARELASRTAEPLPKLNWYQSLSMRHCDNQAAACRSRAAKALREARNAPATPLVCPDPRLGESEDEGRLPARRADEDPLPQVA
jgi:hypothetical protein